MSGVKDAARTDVPIMLHVDRGGDILTNQWFFDNVVEQGVTFDVIGEPDHPFWHGMPDELAQTIEFLGNRYGKKVYLAEIAYPYKHHPMYENALSGDSAAWHRLVDKYPLTPEGAAVFRGGCTVYRAGIEVWRRRVLLGAGVYSPPNTLPMKTKLMRRRGARAVRLQRPGPPRAGRVFKVGTHFMDKFI